METFELLTIMSIGFIILCMICKPKFLKMSNVDWKLSTGSIYNTYTPEKKFQNKKLHEKKCREIVEKIYNKKFPSVRPDFLKNITGKSLELDMYCPELKLAFEYDGVAHAKYSKFFHKGDYNNFLKQQERDKLKDQICINKGIRLIRIPHTVPYNNLESFINSKIKGI